MNAAMHSWGWLVLMWALFLGCFIFAGLGFWIGALICFVLAVWSAVHA